MKKNLVISISFIMLAFLSACGNAGDSGISMLTSEPMESSGTADGRKDDAGYKRTDDTSSEEKTQGASGNSTSNQLIGTAEPAATAKPTEIDPMKEMFGEYCISDQTFEVELSEYSGKVWFVPYAPSQDNPEFYMQIIQNGEVLDKIRGYVPKELKDQEFISLDAVSFFDINYDDATDIVAIMTYGDVSFAAVYYGFTEDAWYFEKYFFSQSLLSDNITKEVRQLTIPKIRSLISDKRNGEFSDYKEAYRAVSELCRLANETDNQDSIIKWEEKYELIDIDGDDIPELAAGVPGYYVSLYTYRDGKVYTLMDEWGYGAMGNAGYEYCPGKNSLRNFNADMAGGIMNTTYMTVNDKYSIETVAYIVTYNWDDANRNGALDPEEEETYFNYSVSYIGDREIKEEEFLSYDVGEYQYIDPDMSFDEFIAAL